MSANYDYRPSKVQVFEIFLKRNPPKIDYLTKLLNTDTFFFRNYAYYVTVLDVVRENNIFIKFTAAVNKVMKHGK